jgi:hypothetical protein
MEEVKKYLDGCKEAYHKDNFYPILMYPDNLKILTYTGNYKISINKILNPVKHKHNFILSLNIPE